jgi:hypothetical protein
MSRRLRVKRLRYFSKQLEILTEGELDLWAERNQLLFTFQRLEFDESVSFSQQVNKSRHCDTLFGPHGAGLGHMIWMKRGGRIIEFGTADGCAKYYRAMANWYGHSYTCFSDIGESGISIDNGGVYQSLNVTLLLKLLDDSVSVASSELHLTK